MTHAHAQTAVSPPGGAAPIHPRWQGFICWLKAGFLGPIPDPTRPPQQWLRLPSHAICMMAQAADEWVQVVLRERQQRGLAWNEGRDAPLFAADLTERLLENGDMPSFPSWIACLIEQEMRRLIRILEAPEHLLPGVSRMGLPYEARYHALALGLARVCQRRGYARRQHPATEVAAKGLRPPKHPATSVAAKGLRPENPRGLEPPRSGAGSRRMPTSWPWAPSRRIYSPNGWRGGRALL